MKDDPEGLIALLEGDGELPALVEPFPPLMPVERKIPVELQPWASDPVGKKWDKIREAFYNAKTPEDVFIEAEGMSLREWLEWACKMAPKQPDVAAMQITTIRVELPPTTGLSGGNVVEVQMPSVEQLA